MKPSRDKVRVAGMTLYAGCDVGAATAKAVVLDGDDTLGFEIIGCRASAVQSATDVMDSLLERLGLGYEDITCCVSTGYGREIVPFSSGNYSEISCHGKGAQWLVPSVRTIIDGGGQDCKAIGMNEKGQVADFRMNTKCAAGTGRAVEIMIEAIGLEVSELGTYARQASNPVVLQEPCCILTEIEIRHLVLEGFETADIAAGIADMVARRITGLARNMGVRKDVAITGGLAKNEGVVEALEKHLGVEFVRFPYDPQIVGAVGAALFARGLVEGAGAVAR
jgi:predicted CoA-substrate-specific enzyme activase